MPDPFPPLLTDAVRFAAARHAGQTRKGSGEPYVTHPLGVMLILARSDRGGAGWGGTGGGGAGGGGAGGAGG